MAGGGGSGGYRVRVRVRVGRGVGLRYAVVGRHSSDLRGGTFGSRRAGALGVSAGGTGSCGEKAKVGVSLNFITLGGVVSMWS